MTILARRQTLSFSAAIAAASGIIVQATYVVPNGKRAYVVLSTIEITGNAAAAGTLVGAFMTITTAPVVRFHRFNSTGNPNMVTSGQSMSLLLASGDTVTISSQNTSAVIVTIAAAVVIEEYL